MEHLSAETSGPSDTRLSHVPIVPPPPNRVELNTYPTNYPHNPHPNTGVLVLIKEAGGETLEVKVRVIETVHHTMNPIHMILHPKEDT